MPPLLELLDGLGALAIALAAGVCGTVSTLSGSPLALVSLALCASILSPFLLVSSLALSLGLLCCLPVIVSALAFAAAPYVARGAAHIALSALGTLKTPLARLAAAAEAQPATAAMIAGGLLLFSPLLLLLGAIGLFWYLLFAPITLPLTVLLCYNWLPTVPTIRQLVVGSPPDTKPQQWDDSLCSGYCASADGCSTFGSSSMRTGPSGRVVRRHPEDCGASDALTSPSPSELAESQATGAGLDAADESRPPRAACTVQVMSRKGREI